MVNFNHPFVEVARRAGGGLPASVVQKIALAFIVDQAHNNTFSRVEATPARTHGQTAVRLTLSDRFYTPTLIRPDNEDAHPPG